MLNVPTLFWEGSRPLASPIPALTLSFCFFALKSFFEAGILHRNFSVTRATSEIVNTEVLVLFQAFKTTVFLSKSHSLGNVRLPCPWQSWDADHILSLRSPQIWTRQYFPPSSWWIWWGMALVFFPAAASAPRHGSSRHERRRGCEQSRQAEAQWHGRAWWWARRSWRCWKALQVPCLLIAGTIDRTAPRWRNRTGPGMQGFNLIWCFDLK